MDAVAQPNRLPGSLVRQPPEGNGSPVHVEPIREFATAVLVRVPFGVDVRALHPEELALAESKPPRRREELVSGRTALRAALAAVGWSGDLALLPGPKGRPALPAGFTGSLTHKDGLAVAVAAPLRDGWTIGVDSEVLGTRDRSAIAAKVLRPGEHARWRDDGARWPELLRLFSLKEAIYKALHPHVPRYIAFEEAEISPDGSICMHLAGGEGPFELRGWSRWEDERLFSFVAARPV